MFPIDKKYYVDPLLLDRPETLALSIITERSFKPFSYVKNITAVLTIARLFQERIDLCVCLFTESIDLLSELRRKLYEPSRDLR